MVINGIFTLECTINLAKSYSKSDLAYINCNYIDTVDFSPFNGKPENLLNYIINLEEIKVLLTAEIIILTKKLKIYIRSKISWIE